MTALELAGDFEMLMGALADIGSAEASDEWRKAKARRVYDTMRRKYPIDATEQLYRLLRAHEPEALQNSRGACALANRPLCGTYPNCTCGRAVAALKGPGAS